MGQLAFFFIKGQIVNVLDFAGHMVSVITQFCCFGAKVVTDKM